MILRFFRRSRRQPAIETLYDRIVAASLRPGLYRDLMVPDTIEGRFEALSLHVVLVLRRLRHLPPPADDVAQDLVDALFRHLDSSLRDMGIGDMGIAKRIKKLAQAFYGRAQTYDAALDGNDRAALAVALGRNVLGRDEPADALADYVGAAEGALARQDLPALFARGPDFLPPEGSP